MGAITTWGCGWRRPGSDGNGPISGALTPVDETRRMPRKACVGAGAGSQTARVQPVQTQSGPSPAGPGRPPALHTGALAPPPAAPHEEGVRSLNEERSPVRGRVWVTRAPTAASTHWASPFTE